MRRALVFALLLLLAPASPAREAPAGRPRGAVIASAHHLATAAGHEVLAEGGNAFDAAVAVSAALAVVEPTSSGIGGGGFFLLHLAADGSDRFVDAREVAPASVDAADYLTADGELDRDRSLNGALAAGIPGEPAALVHLAGRYGRLPLRRSLAPAIRLAREGFPVYPRVAEFYADEREAMERYPGTRAVYLADGDPPEVGEILRQPDLAATLEALAGQGFDGFYRGRVAQALVDGVNAEGGEWTLQDLANYRVVEREPIRFRYRGWGVVTAPPPSSGGIALAQMLQILEAWDLPTLPPAQRTHLIVEAMRRAYRDRTFYLGDPDFVRIPMRRLTSRDYASGLRAGIHPARATPSSLLPGELPPHEGTDTTHFSIIDGEGNQVAATLTVNLPYGSRLVVPGTGVLLNNEMDDFALRPGTPNAFGVMGFEANAPLAGKRMLSSMTPTFLRSPEREAVLGVPGGSRIISMVLLGILGYDAGLDSAQVVALPRFHHQYLPDRIGFEPGAPTPELRAELEALGHAVQTEAVGWGRMHAVEWNRRTGELSGGADPRNPVGSAEVREAATR